MQQVVRSLLEAIALVHEVHHHGERNDAQRYEIEGGVRRWIWFAASQPYPELSKVKIVGIVSRGATIVVTRQTRRPPRWISGSPG